MIVRANISDAKTVAKLAVNMWSSHTIDELTADFEQLLADKNVSVFLFCTKENAVGFAQCQLRLDYVEGTDSSPVGYLGGSILQRLIGIKAMQKCFSMPANNGQENVAAKNLQVIVNWETPKALRSICVAVSMKPTASFVLQKSSKAYFSLFFAPPTHRYTALTHGKALFCLPDEGVLFSS